MVLICFIITLLYVLLIGSLLFGFDKVRPFKIENISSKTTFSIIIPFRNEAENLPELLESIYKLDYSKHLFEIIFIDDASEDDSIIIINKILDRSRRNEKNFDCAQTDIKVISNERKTNSPKKDAITKAINLAKYEWIITTDADCVLPKYWLNGFDELIQKTATKCIVAPVTYPLKNDFLNTFQLLDILSLQGATIGGFGINKPFLCNGANFGYRKSLFKTCNGFEGNTKIASGDDIFLLEKFTKTHPKGVHYLKCYDAIVTTKSQNSWSKLIDQRVRWAAKTSNYNNWFGKFTGLLVLLMNLLLVLTLLLFVFGKFNASSLLYISIIKFNLDLFLIYKSVSFFNQKTILNRFVLGFIVYPFFSVYVVFLSFFKGYTWKGRDFKK